MSLPLRVCVRFLPGSSSALHIKDCVGIVASDGGNWTGTGTQVALHVEFLGGKSALPIEVPSSFLTKVVLVSCGRLRFRALRSAWMPPPFLWHPGFEECVGASSHPVPHANLVAAIFICIFVLQFL